MIRLATTLLVFCALIVNGAGDALAADLPDLTLTADDRVSQEPLTTEKVAEFDPAQPNPHLRRWVLSRKMQIQDWKSRKLGADLTGVRGGVLTASTVAYLRPPGPWYDSYSSFPCGLKKPSPAFSTQQGARKSAEAAMKLWDHLLSSEKFKLAALLNRVGAASQEEAWSKADRVFQEWLIGLDRRWRAQVESEIVAAEWKTYRKEAIAGGFCKPSKKKTASAEVLPETWMDQASGSNPAVMPAKPLTRAPSRRWRGLFALRMDVGVADSGILGQMLVDPATPRSVLSPDWMLSQGLRPEWVEIPEAAPLPVKVIAGSGQDGLGKVARVGYAKISDYRISLLRYLLSDTSIFDEPEEIAACCSGVLGMDLFRRYVLEFQGAKPNAIQLWPIAGYHAPAGYQWVEAREDAKGNIVAVCSDRAKKIAKKLCQDPRRALEDATQTVVFDLPHGKIWYSPEELKAPPYRNDSGVKLVFTFLKGDRVLVVESLKKTPTSEALIKAGLKIGMVVSEVDGIPTGELDLWEVNRRLAGVYGDVVTLKWQTPEGYRAEPLRIIRQAYLAPER